MDTRLQRIGGISALSILGGAVFQLLLFFVYIPSVGFSVNDMSGGVQTQLRLVNAARAGFLADGLVLTAVFSFSFVFVHALYVRLRSSAPSLSLLAAVFGYASTGLLVMEQVRVFTLAKTFGIMFSADQMAILSPVFDAIRAFLENGSSLLIIPWVLLVSVAALRNRELPRSVCYVGILACIATLLGVSGVAPALEFLPGIFWLVSTGVVLIVRPDPRGTRAPMPVAEPVSA
jgi:uncharacterized protein DUF4386